jgi:iron complex outermembrane receptor protein
MKFVYTVVLTGLLLGTGSKALAQDTGGPVELGPVVVTATRQEEESLRIPSHVTVITSEDIQKSNATNAGDLLKTEAGLWVTNTSGSTPSGILIDGRGFNNGGGNGSRVLVLIDGRRANLVDTSNPDWAAIPIESIERIEIVRGPSTALYGDNAMAGVINIITKQGGRKGVTDLSLEAGSYNFWKRKASISESTGALSYYLYGGYESTDGYRENSDYRASNYVGNFAYKTSQFTTLHFRSSYLSNDRLLPGSLTEAEIATIGRRGSVTPQDNGETHQAQFDVGFDSYLDRNNWVELTAGQTYRGEDFRVTFPGAGVSDSANDSRSISGAGKYRLTGQVAGHDSRFMLGVDLLKETVASPSDFIDPTGNNSPDRVTYERRLLGVYAHDEFSIHPSLILTLSGRMDWSGFQFSQASSGLSGDRSFRLWSPKAGLTYLTSPSTSLYATWSKSFRLPNRDELTGFFGFTPALDSERATTYEVGEKIQIGPRWEGTLSAFRTRVENEILFIPPAVGGSGFGQNENIPEVKHEGIEVSSGVRYTETVRFKGSYAMTRTKIMQGPFEGGNLPITPKHAGSATVDWGKEKGLIFSVTGRFVGNRILANDLANNQEKLPGFSVWDARIRFNGESFEPFFGVNNLLNKKYEEFGGVGGSPFGSRVGFNPSPERNFIGGATIRF